jgi:hypothetical protein
MVPKATAPAAASVALVNLVSAVVAADEKDVNTTNAIVEQVTTGSVGELDGFFGGKSVTVPATTTEVYPELPARTEPQPEPEPVEKKKKAQPRKRKNQVPSNPETQTQTEAEVQLEPVMKKKKMPLKIN